MNAYTRLFSEIAQYYSAIANVRRVLFLDERQPQAAYQAAELACSALNDLMAELDRLNKELDAAPAPEVTTDDPD